ncbi:hypothetical protein ACFSQP_01750 [Bizionia sediminis]|uniref:Phage holin family protein n=1 Tax=Bizionia sediminis TaxID=1737064 RepID=A0ABW5KP53_9FLAO
MSIFDSLKKKSAHVTDAGETYFEKTQEYYKLKIFQQVTISVSLVAKALIIGGLTAIGLLFLAFALALAIGNWLDSASLGYVTVGALFVLMAFILYLKRAVINGIIIKKLADKFFDA